MTDTCDVAVIGAGPAGGHAALAASRHGLRTVLVDEENEAGGQVWRARSPAILGAPDTPETRSGGVLRAAIGRSAIIRHFGTRVWHIERDDEAWTLGTLGKSGGGTLKARGLIIATGAQERVVPVPGWTLPGVIGLAAATAMFKRDMMLPGHNTVVAGCGPLLFLVAAEILRLGGRPAAVVSLNSRAEWMAALPGMASKPRLVARGASWLARLRLAGVPVLWRHAVAGIGGSDRVEDVAVVSVDANWAPLEEKPRLLAADSVCLGHGLLPSVEASALAGAELQYRPELGGFAARTGPEGACSVPMLWVCGDAAGIFGAAAAPLQGTLAGTAAALALGGAAAAQAPAAPGRAGARLRAARRFGSAMTRLATPRSGLLDLVTPDTVLCRCEGISRADFDAELASGAASPNALKSGTRLGMGPCGGRSCTDVAAMIAAAATGRSREAIGLPTARPPLRPEGLDDITGSFDYDSLPIPAPAPS